MAIDSLWKAAVGNCLKHVSQSQMQKIVLMPLPGGEGMGGVCAGTAAGKPAEPAVARAGIGAV